jgi:hypothetical protein
MKLPAVASAARGRIIYLLVFSWRGWRTAAGSAPKDQCVLHPEPPPAALFAGNPLEWILSRANSALNANKYSVC